MSDYTKTTNFTAKDSLPSGDSSKVVKGSEIDAELSSVQTAVNSKANTSSPSFTGSGSAVDWSVSGTLNSTGALQINGVSVTATATELNTLDGVTATTAELNKVDGFTGGAADLNYAASLKATGVTSTEFNYLDGVTSNIQTQLNSKGISDYDSSDFNTDFSSKSTSDLSEGTNLYYTDARVNSDIDTRVDKAFVEALNPDAESVDGYDIVVDSGSPSGTDANTIYLVT